VSDRPYGNGGNGGGYLEGGGDRGIVPAPQPPSQLSGLGELGMIIFIAALSMFFLASIVIYLLMRHMHHPWPPPGFPELPRSLWLSTLDIVFTSITVQGAVLAARRGDEVGLRRTLLTTLVLAVGFLVLQSYAWYKVWPHVVVVAGQAGSSYLTMFYFVTGLHAAHVVGGLVPLVIVTNRAYRGMYGRRNNAAVRHTALYWHFLDVVWCAIFIVVYLL
jgi:cytochrome c oxidase subunit 3